MSLDSRDSGFSFDADPFGPVDAPRFPGRSAAPQAVRWMPLVANEHVLCMDELVENLSSACVALGRHPLIVDAAGRSSLAPAAAALDLGACIKPLSRDVSYLPAGGLPRRYVNADGSAERLLHDIQRAAPDADVILVHADATDLARLFKNRLAQPLLLAVDEPESLKQAYAGWKWLSLRCGWTQARLLMAQTSAHRAEQIAQTLATCAAQFMNASLLDWAVLEPDLVGLPAVNPQLADWVAEHLELPRTADRMGRRWPSTPERSGGPAQHRANVAGH